MDDDDDVDILGDFSISSCFPGINSDFIDNKNSISDDIPHDMDHQDTAPEVAVEEMVSEQGEHLNLNAGLEEGILDYDENVPNFIQEEILIDTSMPDTIHGMMSLVNTAGPTIKVFKNKITKSNISLLKPKMFNAGKTKTIDLFGVDSEIYSENDFMIASTELVEGSDADVNPKKTKATRPKPGRKPGNHRRKHTMSASSGGSRNGRSKSKFNISVPIKKSKKLKQSLVKDEAWSGEADDTEVLDSPRLQIVFSSGQALPVSEGEQVIKIEKKDGTESESDVDVDVDSDEEPDKHSNSAPKTMMKRNASVEIKTNFMQRKFEPMRPRQKKVNLDGDGGCTIMHTESGDLIEVVPEPRKEKTPRRQQVQLFHCKHFSIDKPAPYTVRMSLSCLLAAEAHAAGSRAEVMGLLGGARADRVLRLTHYERAAAAADCTHCDMCPVSQAQAAQVVSSLGLSVVGWHHSHPRFVAQPSARDLRTQLAMQHALETRAHAFVALITSQYWTRGRTASHYRCLRVESEGPDETPVGYQLSVTLEPDLCASSLPALLLCVREAARAHRGSQFCVRMDDVCPDAGVTYLEKFISSTRHHLTSAGYSDQDLIFQELISGVRDIFR